MAGSFAHINILYIDLYGWKRVFYAYIYIYIMFFGYPLHNIIFLSSPPLPRLFSSLWNFMELLCVRDPFLYTYGTYIMFLHLCLFPVFIHDRSMLLFCSSFLFSPANTNHCLNMFFSFFSLEREMEFFVSNFYLFIYLDISHIYIYRRSIENI